MMGADDVLKAAWIGIGGTVILDLWAWFMAKTLKVPAPSWPMVGRWIGNMPRGQFVHASMANARPVRGEAAIGWTAHYVIGIGYGLLLLAAVGHEWIAARRAVLHDDARHGGRCAGLQDTQAERGPLQERGGPLDLRPGYVPDGAGSGRRFRVSAGRTAPSFSIGKQ